MSRPFLSFLFFLLIEAPLGWTRQDFSVCGTYRDRAIEELQLHYKAQRRRAREGRIRTYGESGAPILASRDIGDLAIIEDTDGVISRRNAFDLDGRTVSFAPVGADASDYRFQTGQASYDADAATRGSTITGLTDDDFRRIDLPFRFPFFGGAYNSLYVNSDGNLTFAASDNASRERSLGRVTAGPPRIAGLFRDLDPSKSSTGVHVLLEAGRVVVSWVEVPEFSDFGTGPRQTFQIRLFPSGLVEVAFQLITTQEAIVGIAPGGLQGSTSAVSFSEGSQSQFSGAIVERFTDTEEVDTVLVAQKFFQTHEDAYDYLVVFNALGIAADTGAVAFEMTLRNNRSGYGDSPADVGQEYGSRSRLQSFMNMGPVSQYPLDPNAILRARAPAGDTPLTVLGHEAGHLFLAFASIRDPADAQARPMLGRQTAHWNFSFNSEASLLEGNRICDKQAGACPTGSGSGRFVTTATVQGYAPLDQYLMGFRPSSEVPDTFLVLNSSIGNPSRMPQAGVSFDGTRRDINIQEIISAEGRRTPDHTVAQRRFRFGFILVTAAGTDPSSDVVAQVDRYRQEFESFYRRASGERAAADTSLRRSLRLSTFPATGVVLGGSATATVAIERPSETAQTVLLSSTGGNAGVPSSVTIPAGSTSATFRINGIREGVDELAAEIAGGSYERAYSNIQVRGNASDLKLTVVSGGGQTASPGTPLANPVVLRLSDLNDLPYAGLTVSASTAGGGSTTPTALTTDTNGEIRFNWTLGTGAGQEVTATLPGTSPPVSIKVTATAGSGASAVNAATFGPQLSPGSLATLFGSNLAAGATASATLPLPLRLAGVELKLNSRSAVLLYVSDRQINFVVPSELSPGDVDLTVTTTQGVSSSLRVRIDAVSPGIFVLQNAGVGAVTVSGTGLPTSERPAAPGEWLEVYATGLGAVRAAASGLSETVSAPQVTIGSAGARVLFSGLSPGWVGLYQVNVQVPQGTPSGLQTLTLSIDGVRSNDVQIRIR